MSENALKTGRKRGQRRNNIDVPQRLLDRLTPISLHNSNCHYFTNYSTRNKINK